MARIVKKPEERRQEIVTAARRLFQTKEYDQTTMQNVIESVGIAKGTIYHYFKSKKELLEAVINDIVDESLSAMQKVVDETQGNALQKIRMLIESGNMAADQPTMIDYLHKPGNEAMHVRLLAETLAKQAPLYAQLIRQGCEEGIFHTDHPLECTELILAAVQFLTDIGIYPWTEQELSRRTCAFPKLIEQQLQAPSDSFAFMKEKAKEIKIVPYDLRWPQQFMIEAALIKKTLANNSIAIHHIGSTSVPDLIAKPKIDILAVVRHPEDTQERLEAIDFTYRGEWNIPMKYGFRKRGKVNVNLHVYKEGHPEIECNLTFRDYLRNHPEMRNEYAEVKKKLLAEKSSFEKNHSMFKGYTLGKGSFIRKVLRLAGFQRLRFLQCTDKDEWDTAKSLRQRYFFDKVPISDPYTWTFNHPDHTHFVLYQGAEMIGYAHIQLWPESRAAIRIIVVEEMRRGHGFGKQFLEWIETWLKSLGYRSVHTESSPEAVPFYEHAGYTAMPFDDPDGYEGDARDTPMGKILAADRS